jgi:vanillate O-demethylase ferredoxin subunit
MGTLANEAPLALTVAARQTLAEGIDLFELHPPPGQALPPFTAGAHIELQLQHEGRPLLRPYSLCNAPGETHRWQIAVLRVPASRGRSAAVHAQLQPGSRVHTSPPRNLFELVPGARHSLLLAGGIGITPLLAMAEALHAAGAGFRLHHATRSQARTPFIERLDQAPWRDRVVRHLDDSEEAQRLNFDRLLARPEPGTHLYVCGPQGFMDTALARARTLGWPEAQLHWESFGGDTAPQAGDRAFTLVLARSGVTLQVAAGCTAAQAIADAGVFLATSCEQGVCGTCLTPVLEGRPEHRDHYLTPEEQAAGDQFTPCCSRALSERLVIDL